MHHRHPTSRLPLLSLSLTLGLSIALPAIGQGAASPTSKPAQATIEFAETPFSVPSLGLRLYLPVGCRIDVSNLMGSASAFQVFAEDSTWMIRGLSPASRDQTLSPGEVATSLIEGLLRPEQIKESLKKEWNVDVSGVDGRVLDREDDLVIDELPAARFYAQIKRTDGAVAVTGYTVVALSPGKFVLFEFTCPQAEFERARGIFEAIVASSEFRDPVDASAERAAGLLAGTSLLDSLNRDDMAAMLGTSPTMFRLYRPASSGDPADANEVAYQRVQIRSGQRGELDPQRPKARWTAAEKEDGYLVRVDSRFLDGARMVDSQSVYFLTLDRDEEHWSVRMTVRDDKGRTSTWTETGTRLGDTIKVSTLEPGGSPVQKQWKAPPDGYLSQVEAYLLPRMLARFGAPAIFNFYRYNTTTGEISLRRDELTTAPTGEGWVILSRPHENAADERTIVDNQGRIIRRVLPSGVVMEPIAGDSLLQLWKSKGLPID